MEETIREYSGLIVGYIETKSNGDKVGYDFGRRIVGYYDAGQKVTTDFYRRIVARGDILSALVWNSKK